MVKKGGFLEFSQALMGCLHITTVSLGVAMTTSRGEQKGKKIKETESWAIMRQGSLIRGFDLPPRIQMGQVLTCFSNSGAQTWSRSWNKFNVKASLLILNSFCGW